MTKLEDIEGIGPKYGAKLAEIGIKTTGALLKAGAEPKARAEIAQKSGVSPKLILEWVNHADLYRIKGIGSEYSDLLEAAGVDTVVELAQRRADNLTEALVETNQKKKLVRQVPGKKRVEDWIAQAKKLPRVVKY